MQLLLDIVIEKDWSSSSTDAVIIIRCYFSTDARRLEFNIIIIAHD
jgi:hypothetical protein